MNVFRLPIRLLSHAERLASRAEAVLWLAQGKPVIYGAHLRGPLSIASGDHLLISHVHIEGGPVGLDFIPAEWTR